MLVALEEKLRDPQVTYIYIFFYPLGTMNVYTKFNGNWCKSCWSAWVPSKVEDQWFHIYWATPAWWKIHSRYTIKKKKKTVTQAFTNHISSHLWRRKFQHLQNPLLNMTDLKRRARWILLKANPVRSEWRMWSKRKKHKRSIGAHLDTVSFCQDVPECVLKLGEIHLMASSQQRLGWTGTNQTEYFLNDAWTTTS